MNDKQTKLGDLLAGQESANPNTPPKYRQMVRDLMNRKAHGLIRVICGFIAAGGVAFSLSLLMEIFGSMNTEVAVIIKLYMVFLLISVLFYSGLAANVAIRGKIRVGSAPTAIFGALVLAGFFLSLWFFQTFILPKLVELLKDQSGNEFFPNVWFFSLACMLMIIAFFGVISAGITFLIHMMYSQYGRTREKLLEIELALAELSEKSGVQRDELSTK